MTKLDSPICALAEDQIVAPSARGANEVDLGNARPLYWIPRQPLVEEVLIPGFAQSNAAECMVGYFSSGSLAEIAPGLATYVNTAGNSFRLIINPVLTDDDQRAFEEGVKSPDDVAGDFLRDGLVSETALQEHTLKCLSYLLAHGRIQIRIALMRNAIWHPKAWIFHIDNGLFTASGSSNMTRSGMRKNTEQVVVSKAWQDPNQRFIATSLSEEFERTWDGRNDDCVVLDLPSAIRSKVLIDYPTERAPTEAEFLELFRRASGSTSASPAAADETSPELPTRVFAIPSWLNYEHGDFAHQGQAVRAWFEAGCRGTLEMATGSGKTLTSMIAAFKLYEQNKPLLIVVAAPYVPLIDQWCGEVAQFGIEPKNLTLCGGAAGRRAVLQSIKRNFRFGQSDVEVVIVSHDTLCSPEFKADVAKFECHRLLIADEAHNLGRPNFISEPPTFFESRLALSATPVRQYDPDGTEVILDFFGPVVFRFTLKEAIGKCLVPYDYFVHPVCLTSDEMDEWAEITAKIKKNGWRSDGGKPDEYLAKLFRDRRLLLETAEGKVGLLSNLLDQEDLDDLKHTLVYGTDKDPKQLDQVNALLLKKGVLFHQLTAEETKDRRKTSEIISSFQNGEIKVLTAKRVLDEGVNIPQIEKAFVLASTTVERQWIQRRGRLLRTCAATGKTHSIIHDFITMPPDMANVDADARALIKGELRRAQEFAGLARNAGMPDGPLDLIHQLVEAAAG
jgi:superfamily II DNA or RNA helicase